MTKGRTFYSKDKKMHLTIGWCGFSNAWFVLPSLSICFRKIPKYFSIRFEFLKLEIIFDNEDVPF